MNNLIKRQGFLVLSSLLLANVSIAQEQAEQTKIATAELPQAVLQNSEDLDLNLHKNLQTLDKYYSTVQGKLDKAENKSKLNKKSNNPEKIVETKTTSNVTPVTNIGKEFDPNNYDSEALKKQGYALVPINQQPSVQPLHYTSGQATNTAAYTPTGQRDPFAITSIMLKYEKDNAKEVQFTPVQNMKVPKMKLKGIIRSDNKKGVAALLEVDGLGVYVVREGDTVGLQGVGSNNVLQIEEITNLSLVVKAGQLGQRLIVR